MIDRPFSSKILLFGEYTALSGGNALAIPFHKFNGRWIENANLQTLESGFIDHLERCNGDLIYALDIQKLRKCLQDGWRFDSTIPWGKGLGSSAALVASIYQSCAEIEEINLSNLWHDLRIIEAYFHGRSSGLDAVVSLINTPILLRSKHHLSKINLPRKADRFFLLDSQIERKTQPLVEWFRHRIKSDDFSKHMEQLNLLNAQAIEALTEGTSVRSRVNHISSLQYKYLTPLDSTQDK